MKIISTTESEVPFRRRSVKGIRFFISETVVQSIIAHADSDTKEVMGLMIGKAFRDDGGQYATAERTITSDLMSTDSSVRFDMDSPERLMDAVDDLSEDEVMVGWYHSHPGFGCFMSETDVTTHKGIFNDTGFAIVIDPQCKEIKAFCGPDEIMFVVME